MNTKHVACIMTIVAVTSLISAVYVYTYYQGQTQQHQNVFLTLVDDRGYVLNLTSYPNRIVSLAPSNTEILFAIGAGDKVVGVTDQCDYPYSFSAWIEAGNMTNVGYWPPNIEAIVSLNPDLIVAAFAQEETIDTLRGLGYNVLVLEPHNINDILQDIVLVGRATDRNTEAGALVNSLRQRIDAVVNKVAGAPTPKVYYEVWYNPLWSAGSESWQNELIEEAGGINIFANVSIEYFEPSSEAVITLSPDIMIFPLGHEPPFWGSFDQVKARTGWNTTSAVQNDRLYTIDDDIISRSGPRMVDALEILAEIIHPELF